MISLVPKGDRRPGRSVAATAAHIASTTPVPVPTVPQRRRVPRASWPVVLVATITVLFLVQVLPQLPIQIVGTARATTPDSSALSGFMVYASREVLGRSGSLRMETVLPGETLSFPLVVSGNVAGLSYQWVAVSDSAPVSTALPLVGPELRAPHQAGFYRLSVVRDSVRSVISDLTVAVMVPFDSKQGTRLNGYLLGRWAGEGRVGAEAPSGFVQIHETDLLLPLSEHVVLGDFLPHDGQETWPRYAAFDQKLLDKLELVLARLDEWAAPGRNVTADVNAGFRSPSYNRRVAGSATASRHLQGDAIDVAIDANGDGRFTLADIRLIARAVEEVEGENPDLQGGLGLYTSSNYRRPFVHIDTRGERARWQG